MVMFCCILDLCLFLGSDLHLFCPLISLAGPPCHSFKQHLHMCVSLLWISWVPLLTICPLCTLMGNRHLNLTCRMGPWLDTYSIPKQPPPTVSPSQPMAFLTFQVLRPRTLQPSVTVTFLSLSPAIYQQILSICLKSITGFWSVFTSFPPRPWSKPLSSLTCTGS